MQSWHASQMPLPLPRPTDSGEEICDEAGVLRQPYNPWSQLMGKLQGSIIATKRWAVPSWPAERAADVQLLWPETGCLLPSPAHGHRALAPSPHPSSLSAPARHACTSTTTGTRSRSRPRAARWPAITLQDRKEAGTLIRLESL